MNIVRSLVTTAIALGLLIAGGPQPVVADPFLERTVSTNWDTEDLVVADFDADGIPDIAAVSHYGPFIFECSLPPPYALDCSPYMEVVLARGRGLGRFDPVVAYPALCLPWTLAAGDFDADGAIDLVVGNAGARDGIGICYAASLSLFRGDGAGGLAAPINVTVGEEPTDMATGDFDADGRLDVVVGYESARKVGVFHFPASGGIVAGGEWPAGTEIGSLAVGDLSPLPGDEIAVTLPALNKVASLHYFPGGALGPIETCDTHATQIRPASVAIADFVEDGVPDIAVLNRGSGPSPIASVSLLQRGAGGSYCLAANARESGIGGRGVHIAAVDADADGIIDLAATDGGASFRTLHGDGTGFFTASAPIVTAGPYVNQVVGADLDRNGVDDLAVTGGGFSLEAAVVALINTYPAATDLTLDLSGDAIDWIGVRNAQSYDLVRGDLATLNAGGGDYTVAVEACVADDQAVPGLSLADTPPVGALWWILARPNFGAGPGSYDSDEPGRVGSRDAGINASASACP